jgi:hypothetical protein
MIEASCHCGSIRIALPRRPRTLTLCNCSICRRYGVLWAYFNAGDIRIRGTRRSSSSYLWAEQSIRFVRCRHCGCVTHWEQTRKSPSGRVGVNARNLDADMIQKIRIRHLDGASTWKYLD